MTPQQMVDRIKQLNDKLVAMDAPDAADNGVAGSIPNATGAILTADHQTWRDRIIRERDGLLRMLHNMGWTIDASGKAVPQATVVTTYGVLACQ